MASSSRPLGVTLVAIIAWLSGAWSIVQGIIALIQGIPTWNVFAAWVTIFIGAPYAPRPAAKMPASHRSAT